MADRSYFDDANPSAFAAFLQLNSLRFRKPAPISSTKAELLGQSRKEHAMIFRDHEQYESD